MVPTGQVRMIALPLPKLPLPLQALTCLVFPAHSSVLQAATTACRTFRPVTLYSGPATAQLLASTTLLSTLVTERSPRPVIHRPASASTLWITTSSTTHQWIP